MQSRQTPACFTVPAGRHEIPQCVSRNPGCRCGVLAGLGRRLSICRIRVGGNRGRRPMAEGRVDYGNMGVVDLAARPGKLCMAGSVNGSTQGRV